MLISLTTDFGLRDGYVGTMKGVIASIAPGVPLVDITHALPAHDLRAAAYVLWTALPYFPEESVHLVVVDPGVGTSRRAIAAHTPWGVVVGPDNGVFSYVWAAAPPEVIVAVENARYRRAMVSTTFHGRDIFAPAAAHIAAGVALGELGPVVADPVRLPLPTLATEGGRIEGEVIYIDRFGNVITSIGRLVWEESVLHLDPAFGEAQGGIVNAARATVQAGAREIGAVRRTYGETATGDILALVGSEGMLEIAVNQGNAAQTLGLRVGDAVTLVPRG